MRKSKRNFRLGVCGALLGAVYFGFPGSAMAWNEPLWVRQLGTEASEWASGVATDAQGNVYIAMEVGRPTNDHPYYYDYDACVVKYNPLGHLLWKRQLETEDWDRPSGVATDGKGNVYLTGSTYGSLGGANRGGLDAWVAKYDAAGNMLWKRQLGTETNDEAFGGVATDAAGDVYLTGYTLGSLGGAYRGEGDVWVAKYDAAGHPLWKRQLGTEAEDLAIGVATDAAGNVYLTGYTDGSLGGTNRGGRDAWVAKYDAAGDALWTRQLGTETYDVAGGVATDPAGNVYLTGDTFSLVDANRGNSDAWAAKYDAAGDVLWTRQLGTTDDDFASGVATDAAGNVYIGGTTYGSLGGANRGSSDAWVAKYDAAGHVLWTRQLGTKTREWASDVATDAAESVYLTGYTEGSLGGVQSGGDAWVAKYSTQR